MLYNNPRGISCAKCHGKRGEGKIITSFKENNKHIVIKTAPFKNLSFEFFKKALFHKLNIKKILKKDKNSPLKYIIIMPKYNYLTDSEIKAIIYYLKKVNK
jgi:cytochrome c1